MKKILLAVPVIYTAICVAMFALQRDLIFVPSTEHSLPADVGLADVREVTLQTDDKQRLFSWYGEAKNSQPTILFFHGNAGNVGRQTTRIRQLMAAGFGVFVLGYPGYGGSDGAPSETAFIAASRLAYAHLRASGVASNDIVIFGKSLGSAVATQLAAEAHARALILESPMSSMLDLAKAQYPYLPVGLLLRDKFMSIDHIDEVKMPLLIMHGDNDGVVPIDSGQALFAAANDPRTFHTLAGAGHNDLNEFPIVAIVQEFLSKDLR